MSKPKHQQTSCSFCGIDRERVEVMLAGPHAFICSGCVELACGIIVGEKESGKLTKIGPHVDTLAELRKKLDAEQKRRLDLERTIADVLRTIARIVPPEGPS